jgi:hypothetical protein
MQALVVASGRFEDAIVSGQDENIAHRVQNMAEQISRFSRCFSASSFVSDGSESSRSSEM